MKRLVAWAPFVLLAALVGAAALVLLHGGERETVSAGVIGRPAPRFELAALRGGDPITSDAFAGRAYVINFFASWCTPCRAEHPQLMAMQADGVVILGIAYKDAPENAGRFLNELGDPFTATALDPSGRYALQLGVAGAVPETFVIGADGAVRYVHRGPLTEEVVARELLPALGAR
jgi:cytochrome c biogenesis protein CcmG/thiol:disulfide interchange protein DsbE